MEASEKKKPREEKVQILKILEHPMWGSNPREQSKKILEHPMWGSNPRPQD